MLKCKRTNYLRQSLATSLTTVNASFMTKWIRLNRMTSYQIEQANQAIAKEGAECLHKHYPSHAWGVCANVETGLVQVYNLRLSGEWGFVLHIDRLATDPSMRLTIRAGGELLERYNLSRAGLKEHEYAGINFDFKGNAVHQS